LQQELERLAADLLCLLVAVKWLLRHARRLMDLLLD
jgi:hypothetical protein